MIVSRTCEPLHWVLQLRVAGDARCQWMWRMGLQRPHCPSARAGWLDQTSELSLTPRTILSPRSRAVSAVWRRSLSRCVRGSGALGPGAQGVAKCQKCWDHTEPLLLGWKHGLHAERIKKVVCCFPQKQADVQHPRFVGSLPQENFCERRCQLRVMPVPPHG